MARKQSKAKAVKKPANPAKTPPTSTLLVDLPNEVLSRIASLLYRRDCLQLARTCSRLRPVAEEQLYNHINLNPITAEFFMEFGDLPSPREGLEGEESGWRDCPTCSTKWYWRDLEAHVKMCLIRTKIRKLAHGVMRGAIVRGRQALLKKLTCHLASGTLSTLETFLERLSSNIQDICIRTRGHDPDLTATMLGPLFSLLARDSALRSLQFDSWPDTVPRTTALFPLLLSMPQLRILRMSLSHGSPPDRHIVAWSYPLSLPHLTELYLMDVPIHAWKWVAQLITATPTLERLCITWQPSQQGTDLEDLMEDDEDSESSADPIWEEETRQAQQNQFKMAVENISALLSGFERLKSLTWVNDRHGDKASATTALPSLPTVTSLVLPISPGQVVSNNRVPGEDVSDNPLRSWVADGSHL